MHTLPDLQYAYEALEPYIDAKTMELHHSKHHQTYIDKLNNAVKDTDFSDKSVEELIQNLNEIPEDIRTIVRNNGGGHYNHSFFWEIMSPNGGANPEGKLAQMLTDSFGSFDAFKDQFTAAAVGRFGSGWVWLTQAGDSLSISSSPNQDSPMMEGVQPILGLDFWEHAYYLKYQNKRPDYIEAWWNVVNWNKVASLITD